MKIFNEGTSHCFLTQIIITAEAPPSQRTNVGIWKDGWPDSQVLQFLSWIVGIPKFIMLRSPWKAPNFWSPWKAPSKLMTSQQKKTQLIVFPLLITLSNADDELNLNREVNDLVHAHEKEESKRDEGNSYRFGSVEMCKTILNWIFTGRVWEP